MAATMVFKEGDTLIGQGDKDTAAYLIISGWLEVRRIFKDGRIITRTLQAGEIVGELGLAGLAGKRTATVTALTDGEVEVIDRGTLIRLVNKPGGSLTPLLAALFSRLQNALIEDEHEELDDTFIPFAKLKGMNANARTALCNQSKIVGHLPWVFGAYRPPQTVTDLFDDPKRIDVRLTGCSLYIHEAHIILEAAEKGGIQLRVVEYGNYCAIDDEEIVHNSNSSAIRRLEIGTYHMKFGDRASPFEFKL
ncbi:MAG: cyclic nucleotide-binding domain-containing protein, partial [Ghiorsea sp.]|nr:cyclic nucleotide-binding domain-containing protein [Ghiorsea sp.]